MTPEQLAVNQLTAAREEIARLKAQVHDLQASLTVARAACQVWRRIARGEPISGNDTKARIRRAA